MLTQKDLAEIAAEDRAASVRTEKDRAKARAYYARNKERLKARRRAWYQRHREQEIARSRQYIAEHREWFNAYMREYYRRTKNGQTV